MQHTKRPLYDILFYPSARQLDAHLNSTLNLAEKTPSLPSVLVELIHKSLETRILEYKIYTLFIWIVINPSVKAHFSMGVDPAKLSMWLGELEATFDKHLLGLKVDGGKYAMDGDTAMAKCAVFVRNMITRFSDL